MSASNCARMFLFISAAVLASAALVFPATLGSAQAVPGGTCKPIAQRTGEVGCWILTHSPVGRLAGAKAFWYLDRYPSLAAAEGARGPHGTVLESLGKSWLLTIEGPDWSVTGGERVAAIGPLPVSPDHDYSAQYMEAVFTRSQRAWAD